MTRPLARVLTLLELLQSGGLRTVTELADRLEVDERTVRRYAQQLLDLDVPVESVRGRYGGYRIAAGYRMPPLMLSDDEALAVLLGLIAGRRSGLTTATDTARETAAAKIRRVLPERLSRRLDAVLASLAFTDPPGTAAAPEPAVLLPIADAVHHQRPVSIRYTAADGRRSERVLHPYGVVAHSGRWYVTAADPSAGEERTLRLDRISEVRVLPGSFERPEELDPAERVLTALATVPYRHEVALRIQATAAYIHTRLPAGLALVTELPLADGAPAGAERCCRVELRVERLDWLPAVLASLDRPFVIEGPDELHGLVEAFAERLARCARRSPLRPAQPAAGLARSAPGRGGTEKWRNVGP
ncbi:YafY family protein [Streptomyces sp. NPDC006733]|uniref:helix-turn-helix transcriptional regulator n=1 Tax=Streptomyces sp. NPDC006733 TaxID=3155460 RepID=UPI0033EE11A6